MGQTEKLYDSFQIGGKSNDPKKNVLNAINSKFQLWESEQFSSNEFAPMYKCHNEIVNIEKISIACFVPRWSTK